MLCGVLLGLQGIKACVVQMHVLYVQGCTEVVLCNMGVLPEASQIYYTFGFELIFGP